MLLTVFSFGVILTIIPDKSKHLGLENKGVFFTVFTLASLLVRFVAGRASDRYGRQEVLLFACFLYAVGMFVIGISDTIIVFYIGAIIFGFGTGMNSPTVFAWATDLVSPKYRGKAMATVFIALELGIMMGAFFSGLIYDNKAENFTKTFWTGGFVSLLAFGLLLFFISRKKKAHA